MLKNRKGECDAAVRLRVQEARVQAPIRSIGKIGGIGDCSNPMSKMYGKGHPASYVGYTYFTLYLAFLEDMIDKLKITLDAAARKKSNNISFDKNGTDIDVVYKGLKRGSISISDDRSSFVLTIKKDGKPDYVGVYKMVSFDPVSTIGTIQKQCK